MTRSPVPSEQGSALLLVLVLLTVLSLALGALFANAGANLTMSAVVTGQNNKVYAADGGVEYAIQQLRSSSSLCTVGGPLPSTTINGRTVEISCNPTAGRATSVSPWALVTTDTTDPSSLSTQNGDSQTINGPVYVSNGTDLDSPLTVTNGDFLVNPKGVCKGSTGDQTDSPEKAWACTDMPIPDHPTPSLPPLPTSPQSGTPAYVYKGCTIWKPGQYKSQQLHLGTDNYFASGIYYFDNTSIDLDGRTAVGGQRGPDYPQAPALPSTACSSVTDKTAGVADGSGVEFILGGSSAISVGGGTGTAAAQLELFARVPPSSQDEGTPGISIRTVPPSATGLGWDATTGLPVVLSAAGQNVRLAVHGYVYVPEGSVTLNAGANGAVVPLSGGLLCWQASLNSSGGVQISAQSGAQPRYFVITSIAKGDSGQKDITSTAVVSIGNDSARTIDIQSWVTNHP